MLEDMGYDTRVDLAKLLAVARRIPDGRRPRRAGPGDEGRADARAARTSRIPEDLMIERTALRRARRRHSPRRAGDVRPQRLGNLTQDQFRELCRGPGRRVLVQGRDARHAAGPHRASTSASRSPTRSMKNSRRLRAAGAGSHSDLFVPKIHVYKGLGGGFDIGAFVGGIVRQSSATLFGADLRYAFVDDTLTTPAIAAARLRDAERSDLGDLHDEHRRRSTSWSRRSSRSLTPYAGAGTVRVAVERAGHGARRGALQQGPRASSASTSNFARRRTSPSRPRSWATTRRFRRSSAGDSEGITRRSEMNRFVRGAGVAARGRRCSRRALRRRRPRRRRSPSRSAARTSSTTCRSPWPSARATSRTRASRSRFPTSPGGAKALQALVGGSADMVSGAYEHTINMVAKKQPIKAVVLQARYQLDRAAACPRTRPRSTRARRT